MDGIFEKLEQEWEHGVTAAEDWFTRRHGTSQAPAAMPVTVGTTAKEQPMSLATDLRAVADRLEPLGEEAVAKLEAVAANPATAEVFAVLHQLTGIPGLDPTVISEVAAGLKTVVRIYQPQAAA